MAIIKCPECNKEVSDSAETCPHCGYRLKHTPHITKNFMSERASRVYMRENKAKNVISLVCGIIFLILGIVCLLLIGPAKADGATREATRFTLMGLLCLVLGLIATIYSAYRLKND